MSSIRIINADVLEGLKQLEDESVHCVVTSPPYYGLRDYGTAKWEGGDSGCAHLDGRQTNRATGKNATNASAAFVQYKNVCGKCGATKTDSQIGQEPTLQEHIAVLINVFREVRRVIRKDGTFWLNYGDAYNSTNGFHRGENYMDGGVPRVMQYSKREFRPGSGRADGIVDERGQRNRDGISAPGFKPKDLLMMPARLAIALQDNGWYLRSDIIWHKPNPMPESVTDRPTNAYEHIFLLTKSPRYFYDADAVREEAVAGYNGSSFTQGKTFDARNPLSAVGKGVRVEKNGRNMRNVWTIPTAPFPESHFATFPPELVKRCVKAGCPIGGTVLDPFGGSGTTGLVANRLDRDAILIELNPEYAAMAERRIYNEDSLFSEVSLEETPAVLALKQVTLFDEM